MPRPSLLCDLRVLLGDSQPRSEWVWTYAVAIVLDTAGLLLALAVPLLTGAALDVAVNGITDTNPRWLLRYLLVVDTPSSTDLPVLRLCLTAIAASVVGVGCVTAATAIVAAHTRQLQSRLRSGVLTRLLGMPFLAYATLSSASAASLVRTDASAIGLLPRDLCYVPLKACLQLIGTGVAVATVDPRLLFVVVAIFPLVVITHASWNTRVLPSQIKASRLRAACDSLVSAAMRGIRVVRLYGAEEREVVRWTQPDKQHVALESHLWWEINVVRSLWDIVLPTLSLAVLWYFSDLLGRHELTPGDILLMTMCIGMLVSPMHMIAESLASVQPSLASLERLRDVLSLDAQSRSDYERVAGDITAEMRAADSPGGLSLRLQDVSFAYESGSSLALRGLCIEIPKGQVVAVVGRNGSGKTSLLNVLTGLILPTYGTFYVMQKDIREWDLSCYRAMLSMVEQDVYLFPGTVRENVLYGRPSATQSELTEAIHAIGGDGFLQSLPRGIDSTVGEDGAGISGGQRQRLAIARALIRRPQLLVLDEWSSHLDPISEQEGFENILKAKGDATVVVVTHRERIAEKAERVIFLDHGNIVAVGTHDQLKTDSAEYNAFWSNESQLKADLV